MFVYYSSFQVLLLEMKQTFFYWEYKTLIGQIIADFHPLFFHSTNHLKTYIFVLASSMCVKLESSCCNHIIVTCTQLGQFYTFAACYTIRSIILTHHLVVCYVIGNFSYTHPKHYGCTNVVLDRDL